MSHLEAERPLIKDISLNVRSGEILGIAGVDGNGQDELAETIMGLRKVSSGEIFIDGTDVTGKSVKDRHQYISYIPSNKREVGLVLDLSVAENSILGSHHRPPFRLGVRINYPEMRNFAGDIVEEFGVVTSHINAPARTLSGGNVSKLVVARELSRAVKLHVIVNPTMGLDIKTINFVHSKILERRDEGKGVILMSTDLDEILTLSDRVAVIYEGEIMGELPTEKADRITIGKMMGGARLEEAA
jgi:simple sugar transport system ATP-binding protein